MTHNPASGIELFGKKREFAPWPDWMIDRLPTAPFIVCTAAELILGTGQRPNAAIEMRFDQFKGEAMTLLDEKMDTQFGLLPEAAPGPHRDAPAQGPPHPRAQPHRAVGYNTVASAFEAWRASLGPAVKP